MRYYIADTHFNHSNIIQYCNRPFNNVEEMNEELIKRWNNKVTNKDEVFILGDFIFANKWEEVDKILNRLNGKKYLIKGNHDHYLKDKSGNPEFRFEYVRDISEHKDEGHTVILCHYPMLSWNKSFHGSILLYGHIHNNPLPYTPPNSYNVGVDVNDFEPKTLKEIMENNNER